MLLASKHLTAPGPMRLRLKPLWLLALLSGGAPALAAQSAQDTPGFLEGASLEVLSRNFYLNNDYRSPTPAGKSYKQEWAQGFIASFESGFTPGTIGVGVDAHGFLGLKLDGGKGHSGTGLLPLDHDGRSEDSYSSAGGALKFKASRTTLALGEMTVATPVFDTADKRLQPEYASGLLLSSRELEGLDLQAGHFNAFKNQDASTAKGDFSGYGATTRHASIDFIGADLFAGQALGGALYASELSDTWRQYYANLHASLGQLFLDGNLYRTRDQGQAAAGAIDTTAYSLSGKYRIDAQAFTLAYQKIHGDTPFDFVGGDSIYLANSIKYADFNGPGERSWQARYDLDLGALGIPGLSFMARYVSGRGIDGSHAPQGDAYNPFDSASGTYSPQQGRGGRHWERDLDLRYILQSGPAKDLSLQLSHVSHRANAAQAGDDIDRLYIVIQYPLKLGPF
ncbi:OprD family porin [Pseudomonas chlororaphis]|uniref:Porin n=1 Tax=Pseudomonas chlororaphis TaxID=587753 RepID=A0AAX3FPE9_9PSED|nr:OprD family porin [Pseudomonas chlororaphis]AZC38132.1 Outer membrane low permeability porin OccD7/OpdB proline [Pseudomonas chlororaphis subsp. piscium]AZC44678.1 Outer membrane low permeability porin OccD7/OpdB proline [Pseudomonas chlororaphis subsp. piscium]AZC76619.1 Outer membrane low permeability porin OccD7/OpdB proline [Pseudomonas chlororaphis subsp. piscium]WDG70292.1 OprD family porin [Pseudomonas chlororaphis]WDH31922.1 OprD family porin [Pseudomonas chlororaphis]